MGCPAETVPEAASHSGIGSVIQHIFAEFGLGSAVSVVLSSHGEIQSTPIGEFTCIIVWLSIIFGMSLVVVGLFVGAGIESIPVVGTLATLAHSMMGRSFVAIIFLALGISMLMMLGATVLPFELSEVLCIDL